MKAIVPAADALAGATGYRSWSLRRHVVVSVILLAGIVLLAWMVGSQQRRQLVNQQIELAQLEQSLRALSTQAAPPARNEPDFTQRWPQRDEVNAVVRFLGTLAQQFQVNVGQITLAHTASSAQAVGRVDIAVAMNGTYAGGKTLLAELLGRYPSLALQSLTATPRSGDASRIDWTLALTLYVKD
jgi:type II secretory pathway pseudopilin PulG